MQSNFSAMQTSVPDPVMTHCRQLANVHYSRRLKKMYVHMLEGFLTYAPWKAAPALTWRPAQTHPQTAIRGSKKSVSTWVPMNMLLPADLAERVKNEISSINSAGTPEQSISLRTFLFTAVAWWLVHVYEYDCLEMLVD
jgi:hypothetical protein